jgi:choline-sulfatase
MLDARAAYFGMIENLDSQIGEVREAWNAYLKRQQRQGLFFYLSDHGDQAGEHHMYGKQTFFEGSAGIPLMVAGDGVGRGRRMTGAVSMIDVGPTLCEITFGLLPPKQGGQSLARQIFEGVDEPERAVISEYLQKDDQRRTIPGRMLRQGNWKLISYDQYEEYDLLFDLQEDPWETTNLRHSQPERYAELKRKLSEGWDIERIKEVDAEKQQHYRILNHWGKRVQAEETERWPIPEYARILPEK